MLIHAAVGSGGGTGTPRGKRSGCALVGGAQDRSAPLPLRRGQAVVDIVGRHQAEGPMAMSRLYQGKNHWQKLSASS